MNLPTPLPTPPPLLLGTQADLQEDAARVVRYLVENLAPSTRRAYQSDWASFTAWCADKQLAALPASGETVAAYLAAEAAQGRRVATLRHRLAAIRLAHDLADQPNPTAVHLVHATLAGIARVHGAGQAQKAPAVAAIVKQMCDTLDPTTRQGRRDRALLTLGFASAMRRSELVAITVADLEFNPEGVRVRIPRSKTDQQGLGQVVAVIRGADYCPVAALQTWLAVAGIVSGPVFRRMRRGDHVTAQPLTDRSVADIIKRCAAACGLNPADYAGHSLRAGFLTSAAQAKADLHKLMEISRHTDPKSVLRYIRRVDDYQDHAGKGLL